MDLHHAQLKMGKIKALGKPSGSTWWSKQRIWTTTLRAKGSQHHGWWSLHSTKLLWMLRNIQLILVLDQHGKSWTPKTIECHFFLGDFFFLNFDLLHGMIGGRNQGRAPQNTWLTCRMSLLFTWCRDIWFSHCFFLQSTPYLSRCVIICSTFNPGRMHHELYIYIYIRVYCTYLCLHSLSSYHVALTCLDYPYLHFWPVSISPHLRDFPSSCNKNYQHVLRFHRRQIVALGWGFCHRQPGYISGRIPHTFLQEIHRRVYDSGYAQV